MKGKWKNEKKQREVMLGENNPTKRPDVKEKLKKIDRGYMKTEDYKKALSRAKKGKNNHKVYYNPNKIHFEEICKLKKEFEDKGYRFIPIGKVIPDGIAIKENKVFAVELEHNIPRYDKYNGEIKTFLMILFG